MSAQVLARAVGVVGRCQRRSLSTFLPKAEVTDRVLKVVKSVRSAPPTVGADASFAALGFDSLVRKELWTKFEDEFCVEVPAKDAEAFVSVDGVSKYFAAHPKAR
jgi:acyl carrier protein